MNKLYVFAIGGTGSRVLRSLTMLLASGVDVNYEIVPMILDPDSSNGDLCRTVDLMRLYQKIHSKLTFNNNIQNEFFKSPLSCLTSNQDFLLPLIGTSGMTFESYLNLSTMSFANKALMRMLFSNANLASDMNVGFKGNPNIGSIVLNQFAESSEFTTFASNFANGDRVFIISSIFGGTGASGFPLLLKTMRTNKNTALANASIGAVSVLPYFNLKPSSNSSIQAESFVTKTKAALNYYERNVTGNDTLNHIYYVADDFTSVGYENCDGGGNQINNSHLVELLAALSVVNFARKDFDEKLKRRTQFHEFGLHDDPNQGVVFSNLDDETNRLIRRPLSMFTIMNAYLNKRNDTHRASQTWAKEYNGILGSAFWNSEDYSSLRKFGKSYESWLDELKKNTISFQPFKLGNSIIDALDLVVGMPPSYGFLNKLTGKKSCDLIDIKLDANIKKIPNNLSAIQVFAELFFRTLKGLCIDTLKM